MLTFGRIPHSGLLHSIVAGIGSPSPIRVDLTYKITRFTYVLISKHSSIFHSSFHDFNAYFWPGHCYGGCVIMTHLDLCSAFLQNCLNLSETKLVPLSDIILWGISYLGNVILQHHMKCLLTVPLLFCI